MDFSTTTTTTTTNENNTVNNKNKKRKRDHNKIIDDVKQGYISKEYVNKYYPDVKL